MRKLIEQVLKFGIVGIIAFLIDFGIMQTLVGLAHMNATLSGTISFVISLIFNYLASMKYVFRHRDDMARWMEMFIFLASSVIGLLINDAIIAFFTSVLIPSSTLQTDHRRYQLYSIAGKLIATVVVAVWNFCIRKWLLDAPDPNKPVNEHSAAHVIGSWSLTHGPGAAERRAAQASSDQTAAPGARDASAAASPEPSASAGPSAPAEK